MQATAPWSRRIDLNPILVSLVLLLSTSHVYLLLFGTTALTEPSLEREPHSSQGQPAWEPADANSSATRRRLVEIRGGDLGAAGCDMNCCHARDEIVGDEFIYVYDIGNEWNVDLSHASVRWWSQQYEPESEVFDMLKTQNMARTKDPEKATLFYVPFLSARFTLAHFTGDSGEHMRKAVEETSEKWTQILTRIKQEFPFFARHNGRDHFSVLTMDHGRCTALTFCDPTVYGEMFFFQLNADKMVRSNHATTQRGMQALTFNYKALVNNDLPDIPCYMADRDIPIPPISTSSDITKPWDTSRPITALFRFSGGQHHGVPIPHFNHLIRKELLEMYDDKDFEGWSMAVKSEWNSRDDWKQSKFCICPPGHSQWTSRPAKAILAGCIPVNFYRDHDNPWQDEMAYEGFTLNIDAERLDSLKDVIDAVLQTPGKLEHMQAELAAAQEAYVWGDGPSNGARVRIMRALRRRAAELLWQRPPPKKD